MNKANIILISLCGLVLVSCDIDVLNEKDYTAHLSYYLDGEYRTSNGGGISVNVNYVDGKIDNVIFFLMWGLGSSRIEDQNNGVQFRLCDTELKSHSSYVIPYQISSPGDSNILTVEKDSVGYIAILAHFDIKLHGTFAPTARDNIQKISFTGTFDAVMVDRKTQTDTVHITDGKMYYSHLMYVEYYH